MKNQFELKLYNATLANLLIFLSIPLGFILAGVGVNHIADQKLAILWVIFILGGGAYGVHWALKKWISYPVAVRVKPNQLEMRRLDVYIVTIIPFAEVVSYRFKVDNGVWQLHFKLFSGGTVKLQTNYIFGEVESFIEMAQAVGQAASVYQRQIPAAMLREKGFFEKSISTVILTVYTGISGLIIGIEIHRSSTSWAAVVQITGIYLLYLYLWYRDRKQRGR